MAGGDTTFNWSSATATVNVGEAITVTSTVASISGLSYTVADPTIATATTQNYTSWTITGVSVGTTTVTVNGASSGSTVLTVTVKAADDEEYLNKRGLTHFWDNIDTLKQDKLGAGDVTTSMIDDGAVTSAKIDWSTMGPVWSSFYFSGTTLSDQTVNVTTKKGTALTIRISAGGTAVRIISGADNLNIIRQYWSAKLNSVADQYGVLGLKSASTVYTRFFGSRGNTAIGEGEVPSTASSGTDGMCDADLGSVSNLARTSTTAEFTILRESTDVDGWSIDGTIGSGGILATASFEAKTISAAGYAPTVYQRSATSSNTSYVFNCIEVLEN